MGLPPLIERELRCAARSPRTYRSRLITAIFTSLVGIAFVLPGSHNIALVGTNSRGVFWWMSGIMVFYGMVLALFLAGDALASERREKTLELLRLTELEPFEILMGKLFSTGIGAFQGLLGFSLTLALAILAGGVTLAEFAKVAILALNCLFLSLSVGLFASCHCRDGRVAAVLGLIILALIGALPLIGSAKAFTTPGSFTPNGWAYFSPFTTFQLCDPMKTTLSAWAFWRGIMLQHLLAWAILSIAARRLRFHWRSEENGTWIEIKEWIDRRIPKTDFSSLDAKERKEENPIFWLLTVKYGGPAHRLSALLALALTSLLVFTAMRPFSSNIQAAFTVLISWHVFVKLWVAWVASHLMTEMRRSGMLELTLTTPMDWRLILDGWLIGLKRVFLFPVAILFGIDLLSAYLAGERLTRAFGGLEWFTWIIFTLLGLAMETYALTWLGLLCGIKAKNTTRAWLTSISIVLLLPWFCVASLFAVSGVGYLPGISAGIFDLTIARLVFGLLITIGVTAWTIDQMRGHLRENLVKA